MGAPFDPHDLEDELRFTFSRSSGPGGQNVNKVETRVTLYFDVENSPTLTMTQKQRIGERLATRISNDGVMRVSSQRHRTRSANRDAACERFYELIAWALRRDKPRRKTRVSKAAKKRRLDDKRRRGDIKRRRSGSDWD